MKNSSILICFCICIALLKACTNPAEFNTPRTITNPVIANDTIRPNPGGVSTLRITSFTPTVATSGTLVAIIGSGFRGATSVSFGGVPAISFTVTSDSLITAVVGPYGTSGSVSVRTSAGTTSLAGFSFVPTERPPSIPTIFAFTPISGGIGTQVRIQGQNFSGATTVNVGGVPVQSYTVLSSSEIIAILGMGATGNVSVVTPNGAATLAGFTFIATPTITSFTPTSASAGAVVTINGSNFIAPMQVQFGGVDARSFTIISPNQISAIVSSTGATGSVSVGTRGGIASLSGFTFLP